MKKVKRLSLLLCAVLFFNIAFVSGFKVKAEEVTGPQIKSVIVDRNLAKAGDSVKISVEAINIPSGLGQEAALNYISPSGQEKSIDLFLNKAGRYEGKIDITEKDEEGMWKINFIAITAKDFSIFAIYNSDVHGEFGQDMTAGNIKVYKVADVNPPVVNPPVVTPPVVNPPTDTKLNEGWNLVEGKWYFGNVDGSKKIGWVSTGGKWYYLQTDGIMKTGWVLDNNKWYYLNSNGAMQTGWILDNGNWYYLYGDGSMAANTTINGYKVSASGAWIN